ncbi:MAG TPA: calcium-binding protein [Candidatus Acidoferrales bacterium]|nr:calcium-binding protein [Candidatus Acidoferrales bacterium]
MKRPAQQKEREDRFLEEVVVDAYGEEERAMGWYYYAADNIVFPFSVRCSAKRATSPLKIGNRVQVIGMADADDCAHELMVVIRWQGEKLAVPLQQLEVSPKSGKLTRQVVADWHYWVARGCTF